MSDITWSDIDFGSQHTPKTKEERRIGIPDVPPEVTNIEIQEFAIEHFPEGPAAAIEPQKAWLAYKQSVAAEKAALPFEKQFFFNRSNRCPTLQNDGMLSSRTGVGVISIYGFHSSDRWLMSISGRESI